MVLNTIREADLKNKRVLIRVDFNVPLKDGKLTMEIFIDRSLVEGYFNADKAISVRSYADPTAQEIRLFGEGEVQVLELRVFTVSSIYQ